MVRAARRLGRGRNISGLALLFVGLFSGVGHTLLYAGLGALAMLVGLAILALVIFSSLAPAHISLMMTTRALAHQDEWTPTSASLARLWVQALRVLAPDLPKRLLTEALTTATSIPVDSTQAEALTALAPYLPEPQRTQALTEALSAASAIDSEYDRVNALTALAPHLCERLLAEALTTAGAIDDDFRRVDALIGLAPHLCERLLAEALTTASAIANDFYRANALTGLAPHVGERLAAEALSSASEISTILARVRALSALAPYLPEPQRTEALNQALPDTAKMLVDSAQAERYTPGITYQGSWQEELARALTTLALQLPETQRNEVIDEALVATSAITDPSSRTHALRELAPHLAAIEAGTAGLGSEALSRTARVTSRSGRYHLLQAIGALAPLILEVLGEHDTGMVAESIVNTSRCRW